MWAQKKVNFLIGVCCVLFLAPAMASADSWTANLDVSLATPNYITMEVLGNRGGGSFDGSTLTDFNPAITYEGQLAFLYCIDLVHFIYEDPFDQTQVNNEGKILGVDFAKAPYVAYLLNTYGFAAADESSQTVLQAAIWTVVTGHAPTSLTTAQKDVYDDYMAEIGDGATGDVSTLFWITPGRKDNNTTYQALVGAFPDGDNPWDVTNPVPEPTTMVLLGIGLLGVSAVARRRNR